MLRRRRIAFHLFAQPANVDRQRVVVNKIRVLVPKRSEQLLPRQHLSPVAQKTSEQPQLRRCQLQRLSFAISAPALNAHRSFRAWFLLLLAQHATASELRTNARAQLAELERLRDIIVAASIQRADHLDLLIHRCEKNDRHSVATSAHFFAQRHSAAVWQRLIQKQQIIRLRRQLRAGLSHRHRHVEGKAFLRQRIHQAIDQTLIVF